MRPHRPGGYLRAGLPAHGRGPGLWGLVAAAEDPPDRNDRALARVSTIVRTWKAYATPEKVRAYREHLASGVLPELRKLQGFQGLDLCETPKGGRIKLLVISRWESIEAIKAFAGADPHRAVVEPGAKAMLAQYDEFVTNYEVTLDGWGPQ